MEAGGLTNPPDESPFEPGETEAEPAPADDEFLTSLVVDDDPSDAPDEGDDGGDEEPAPDDGEDSGDDGDLIEELLPDSGEPV